MKTFIRGDDAFAVGPGEVYSSASSTSVAGLMLSSVPPAPSTLPMAILVSAMGPETGGGMSRVDNRAYKSLIARSAACGPPAR